MSDTVNAQGAKVFIIDGVTRTQIKGFKDWSGIQGGSSAVIDTTDLDSLAREKDIGLKDEGQVNLSLNYWPKDPGQQALAAARNTQSKLTFELVLKDGTEFAFDGFVLNFGKDGSVDAIVTASATIEVTGVITETPGA